MILSFCVILKIELKIKIKIKIYRVFYNREVKSELKFFLFLNELLFLENFRVFIHR